MTISVRTHWVGALLSLCGLSVWGSKDRPEICPVEGRLFVAGRPAAYAHLHFYPLDVTQHRTPVAITAADGTFRLTTIRAGDGAPEGRYDITVIWPDYSNACDECGVPLHDRLKLHYAHRKSTGLHAFVTPGKNEVIFRLAMPGVDWSVPRKRDAQPSPMVADRNTSMD